MISPSEQIAKLETEVKTLRETLSQSAVELHASRAKLAALALRSGELERTAQLVAARATELCRQLRGGGMDHLRTEP